MVFSIYCNYLCLEHGNEIACFSKVILTGATGGLGSRILASLTRRFRKIGPVGIEKNAVRCLVQLDEDAKKLLAPGVEVHYSDITDNEECDELLRDEEINDLDFQPICELINGMRRRIDCCLKRGHRI